MKSLYDVTPCSSGRRRELVEPLLAREIGDRDVEPVVDDRLALALAVPNLERLAERLPLALDAEVDVGGRAAERGRRLARLEVVDRRLAAPRHRKVRVRVDRAGNHVLPRRVDRAVRADVERFADRGDPFTLDVDVGDVVVGGGDHPAALDQHGHERSFRENPRAWRSQARRSGYVYLPPAVTLTVIGL